MIVDDLDIEGIPISPNEANSVLVVDAYRVLSLAIMFERVQSVIGWNRQVLQLTGRIEHPELSPATLSRVAGNPLGHSPPKTSSVAASRKPRIMSSFPGRTYHLMIRPASHAVTEARPKWFL
jgi:hypothetical protein